MKMIVYAVEAAERPRLERYGKQFGWELTLLAAKPEQNNAAQAEGMDVVNVLSSTYITPKLLDAYRAGGVKMVVSRTVGVEHIDVAYANAVGIAVGNAPYSPASVADYAIMMMLMVLRHIKPMLLRYAGGASARRWRVICRDSGAVFWAGTARPERIFPILWKRWSWTSCFRAAISCRCT